MTYQYRGDTYDRNSPIEMAQVQPHEPNPVQPSDVINHVPSYTDEESSDSHITLHQAARDGRIDIVNFRIKKLQGRSRSSNISKVLDKRDENRTTALHYAVRYGHVDVAKTLIEAGASFTREGEDGATALHYAARFRATKLKSPSCATDGLAGAVGLELGSTEEEANTADESLIKYMVVDCGADVNCQDKYGWTPLHFAASKRNIVATTEVLAINEIRVDLRDKSGQTSLHIAANEGDNDVVCALLNGGADPCAKDNDKMTPLHFAASEGRLDVAVELLNAVESKRGPESVTDAVNDRNSENETVLHSAVEGGHLNLVKLCLEKGANVRAVRNNFAQPLHLAAINGHKEIAELLISHQAKIEAKNNHQETPLHKAAFFNRILMVEFLLSRGADIESRNKDNSTPLLMAAVEGHTQLVQLLLTNGARMTAKDSYDKTAIFLAAEENNVDTLQVLLEHADAHQMLVDETDLYEDTPLHISCTKGYSMVAMLLLKYGAQIDARNEDEHTPLHLAAKHGKIRCLTELLKKDNSILNDEDEASNTTLHLAALEGQVKCVRELLENGAEVDARNSLLWTPLDCAAAKGQVNTAEVLLEYDAPVDPKDKAKTTPLHLASTSGHTKLVELLLKHGADISLADHTGRNCLDMAIDNGHKDCAAAIINDENWMEAMYSKTKEGKTATTPMRKLICKLPDVAEMVFNKCVEDNGKHIDHPYYEVRLNYELLEDVYADWFHISLSDSASVHSLVVEAVDDDSVYHKISGDREEEEATLQLEKKANHPLILMVDTKREHLLSHPLVTFLLQYKWRTFGRYVYYTKLFIYCLFLFFLTSYTVYTTQHPPEQINGTCVSRVDKSSMDYKVWMFAGKWIIIVLAAWHLLIEVFQMMYQRRQYFVLENLLEWIVFVLAIVYVAAELDFEWLPTVKSCWNEKQSVGAVSIFLAWTNLVLFIRKFPLLGIYVVMFTDILRTFLKFSLIFALFIVSFALSFYTLLSSQAEFKNPGRSIVKTVVMMIGEFDFANIFYPEDKAVPNVTWALFVVFVIIVTLLLMNLLIGLAVDDIKGVQEQAVLTRHAMQVDLALDVERALPRKLRKRLMTTKEVIQPNQFHGLRAYLSPAAISPQKLRAALNPERTTLEKMELQNNELRTSVASIKSRIKTIQTTQEELVAMVKAVVEKLEASVEDESEKGEQF